MRECKTNYIKNNESGFTLLEVLIAIAILSMLMVSIYTIIDNSTNTKDKILTEDREKMQFETAMARLESDIEFLHSPLYFEVTAAEDTAARKKAEGGSTKASPSTTEVTNDGSGQKYLSNENFEGLSETNRPIPKLINDEKGSIIFLSSSGRRLIKNSKQSNLQWVRYSVVSNQEPKIKEASYALTRTIITSDLYRDQLDWDKAKEHIIIENLSAFEFNFWDPKREKYVESMREMTADKKTPRLIKVKLSYINSNNETYDIVRTYRPIWPKVDTKKFLEEKYKAAGSSSTPTGQPSQ